MPDDLVFADWQDRKSRQVRVWDPLVRAFHWTVVAGVVFNLLVAEGSDAPHRYAGYIVTGAIAVRLVWGLAARGHARLSSFLPSFGMFWEYMRQLLAGREPRYLGHNPAGAAMMAVLVFLLGLCGLTGWMQSLDRFWGVEWVQWTHRATAYTVAALALVHVAAAIREGLRHNENLVWSMVTGCKRPAEGTDIDNAAGPGRG